MNTRIDLRDLYVRAMRRDPISADEIVRLVELVDNQAEEIGYLQSDVAKLEEELLLARRCA